MNRSRSTTQDLVARCPQPGDLTALQHWMVELIRHDERLAKTAELAEAAAHHFQGSSRLSPAEQIDIYREQFWLRHTSSLVDDFPGLTGILGRKEWESLVESYLNSHSFDERRLGHLGRLLADYIESIPAWPNGRLCADMARLEWAYLDAFDAANDQTLNPARLAAIGEEEWAYVRFKLSSSLHLLELDYPVAELRRAIRAQDGKRGATVLPERDAHCLVVYRRQGRLWDKRISRPAFRLLEAFSRGLPLIAACERVVAQEPDAEALFERELTAWFALWGRLSWITDVDSTSVRTVNGAQQTSKG